MAKEFTDEQLKAYMENPDRCPYCASDNIAGGVFHFTGKQAFQQINCEACGSYWWDQYDRSGALQGRMGSALPPATTLPAPKPKLPYTIKREK